MSLSRKREQLVLKRLTFIYNSVKACPETDKKRLSELAFEFDSLFKEITRDDELSKKLALPIKLTLEMVEAKAKGRQIIID